MLAKGKKQMIKIVKRQYHVQPNETITFGAQASGTAHVLNYEFDDGEKGVLAAGQPLIFKVTTSTRVLNLLCTFTNNSGGKYLIGIQGDAGGSDTDNVDQGGFGIPAITATYRFQL
jgi:hypothetical protein